MTLTPAEKMKRYRARKRNEQKQADSETVTVTVTEKHGGKTSVTEASVTEELEQFWVPPGFEPWTVAVGTIYRPGEKITLVDIKKRYAALKAVGKAPPGMVSIRYPEARGLQLPQG